MNSEQTYTPSLSITKQQRIPALGSTQLPFPHSYDNQAVVASTENVTVSATSSHPGSLDHLASDVFVGRERELSTLREELGEALAGRGRVVVVTGEPGIGKTRTATELAAYARSREARVLSGYCYEGDGAPPFWPWVQLLRAYTTECAPDRLAAEMGPGGADIAQVVADVRDRLPDLPIPSQVEPEQARFRFFDSVATFLKRAARTQPLVLLFDDLHWADAPSLSLLQFVAQELGESRLLVVVTCRDGESEQSGPLTQTLGALARTPGSRTVILQRLSVQDVTRFVDMTTGHTPPAGLATAVYQRTEGHPFFMTEVVRLLTTMGEFDALRIPHSVRSVIKRRLARLSEACQRPLTVAAVIGREFELTVLETVEAHAACHEVGAHGEVPLLGLVDEAMAAHLITGIPHSLGRYSFSHALIRDTLYEGLTVTQRIQYHRLIGAALETLSGVDQEPRLAELAHHFFAAARGGEEGDKAIDYACRAAERAVAALAYEDAATHYEHALQALALHGADPQQRCDLLLALGKTLRQAGDIRRAREIFQQAADLARALDVPTSLARAALGFGGNLLVSNIADEGLVRLLEEALHALEEGDSVLRTRLMARLAMELHYSGPRERCVTLSQQAVAMARRCGNPAALAAALCAARYVVWAPEHLEERRAAVNELIRLAYETADKEYLLLGYHWLVVDTLEQGDVLEMTRAMAEHARLAEELRQPLHLWYGAVFRAMRAFLAGRLEEGEQLAHQACMVGQRTQPLPARYLWRMQELQIRSEQGRLEELEETVRNLAEKNPCRPAWWCALSYLYSETEREPEARALFERLTANDCAALPRDPNWLPALHHLSHVCAVLNDTRSATLLYKLLLPYARHNIVVGFATGCFGSVSHALGLLAVTCGRFPAAVGHFTDALEMNAQIGARCAVAGTQYEYARMLLTCHQSGDPSTSSRQAREQARALLGQALATAQKSGMVGLEKKASSLLTRSQHEGDVRQISLPGAQSPIPNPQSLIPPTLNPQPLIPSFFRRDGDYWTVGYQGAICRLKDLRGLHYLGFLLRHPHHEFYALELATSVTTAGVQSDPGTCVRDQADHETSKGGLSDAGTLLDPQARAAYKHRVQDLREELEEARAFNDPGRVERAQEEIEFLTRELARAVGLGGRQRLAASAAERARTNITHAIKAVLRKISEYHPALGRHLTLTIKTGVFCSYMPDPRVPLVWQG